VAVFEDGELTFGSMPNSRKGAEAQSSRDPTATSSPEHGLRTVERE
jgi:hypothetical protein